MAKKKGMGRPPKPEGPGKMVRIEPGYAAKARAVATDRGITIGEYILRIAADVIDRDYLELLRGLEKRAKLDREPTDDAG
jgi:hypothetical protein